MAPINLNNEKPELNTEKGNYNEIDKKNTSISMRLVRKTRMMRIKQNAKSDRTLERHKDSNVG